MHKKAKTFPLYSKSRIRYFRFIAKHKNSREEDKTFPLCGEKNSGDGYEDNDYIDFNDNNCSNNA